MDENRIFSDDEVENRFMDDISWINPRHWLNTQMPWNTIHGEQWKRIDALGSGSYGAVSVGERISDNKSFAVKSVVIQYPLTSHVIQRIETQINEIYMMRFLRSKYVPRCLGCGRSNGVNGLNEKESLDVFMEYAPRGSLKAIYNERLQVHWMGARFAEDPYVRQYTYDLLKALQYIHSKRVVHGDIKMANILVSDNCLMLADWGGAKQLKDDLSNLKKFLIGTRGFKSPEVSGAYQQSFPADIFSLGCTIIEMFTGTSPQQIQEHVVGLNQFFEFRRADVPGVVIPDSMTVLCKDFLKLCLCKKLEDRWTAEELLHHPFIANRNKADTASYAVGVKAVLPEKCLNPPRCRMDPELDDGQPTWRVSNHLKWLAGVNISQSWLTFDLPGNCAPMNSSQVYDTAAAGPTLNALRARVPDFYEEGDVSDVRVTPRAIATYSTSHTDTENRSYVEPDRFERIIVDKPKDPKSKRQHQQQANNVAFSSVTIVPSAVAAQDFLDTMLTSMTFLAQTNTAIFQEAKEEAEKKDTDSDAKEDELFPRLKRLRKSRSGRSYLPTLLGIGLHRASAVMGCQGGQAIDAVEPLSIPRSSQKGKRKVSFLSLRL